MGGAHRMRTRHTFDLLDVPSTNIHPLPMEDTHITPLEVPSTPPVVSLVASSLQPFETMSITNESISTINQC